MVWGIAAFAVGLFYGWLAPGRQEKGRVFLIALFWGLLLAVILTLVGAWAGQSAIGLGEGFLGFVVSVLIISLLFVLGVWVGDLIEGAVARRRSA